MKLGSLFSGYGGLDQAVHAAFGDVKTAWLSDFDTGPNKILAHRYPNVPNIGDITQIDWAQVEPVDIIAGGFPCQDVSLAGRRAGMAEGTRSNLWGAMRTAIETIRPRYVVAENVRGLLSATANSVSDVEPGGGPLGDGRADNLRALGRVLGDLADLGYDAGWCGLRAADVGAPHGRFRVFIVAEDSLRGGSGGWTGVASDSASERPEPGSDPSRVREVALLPTPVAQPSGNTPEDHLRKKPGRTRVTDLAIMVENDLLATGGQLLPTPQATEGQKGTLQPAEARKDQGHQVYLSNAIGSLLPTPMTAYSGRTAEQWLAERPAGNGATRSKISDLEVLVRHLLPTPTTSEGNGIGTHGTGGADLRTTIALLPTPVASDANGARNATAGRSPGSKHSTGTTLGDVAFADMWGAYAPAIERWEHILGRPAPAPTEPGTIRPRLSARFVEWMMGLPAGWVTDTPGISRNEALKALGNGVVPLQCEAALRHLQEVRDAYM